MIDESYTIYVVDDDAAVRDSMRTILESHDMTVIDYGSAREFLADARPRAANACLLLDQHMPDMNGIELVATLRAAEETLPIVMLSGRADPRLRARALDAGAAVMLDKPVNNDDLLDSIKLAIAAVDRA